MLRLTLREFCIAQFTVVTVVIALGLFAYVFTTVTGFGSLLGFLRLLDVQSELSIPTFVSVINLFLASILILIIYFYEKNKKQRGAKYWLFLSVLFLYLSIDESASIHENFANIHDYVVQKGWISPIISSHEWLPFGILFVAATGFYLLPFVYNLAPDTRRYFVFAGCVFVTGAVGFEYLGSVMLESGMVESKKDMLYLVRRIFEEGFEMYGIAIFNCALYREILRREISVVFGS